jgi:hypothetical protein
MSRIYLKPFTFKRVISFVFLGLSLSIFNNNAYSEEVEKITGHYYVAKDSTYTKYNDVIQWEVTSTSQWSKFMDSLKTMPKDVEKNNPMGLRQPEVIHFNVANTDQKSGHDIFISQGGIQQFSRMPLDVYYSSAPNFREFLENELKINPGYDTTTGKVDINTPGIVVIYHGSSQLKNPCWIIKLSDKAALKQYQSFINSLNQGVYNGSVNGSNDDNLYEDAGTFQIYLNYPDARQQIMVVGTDNTVRGTKIEQKYFYYKDEPGFFSMFKRQAEDNLHASKVTEEAPEEKRKKEVAKGTLF